MKDIFFHEKSKRLLLDLTSSGKKNVSEIAKDIDCTYAHTFNLVKAMERQGILRSKKDGRVKLVSLTGHGKELASMMRDIEALLEGRIKAPAKKTRTKRKRASSASSNRLQSYASSIEELFKGAKGKRISAKERAKMARLAGRYRALVHKLRPKDRESRDLKSRSLARIDEISSLLSAGGG